MFVLGFVKAYPSHAAVQRNCFALNLLNCPEPEESGGVSSTSKQEFNRMTPSQTSSIPIVEEKPDITKRQVVVGRVKVKTVTHAVDEMASQELISQGIEIERVPIEVYIEHGTPVPTTRVEGNVTIIPVLEEVMIVERKLLWKEDVRIIHNETRETAEFPVTLRKQRAIIERLNSEGQTINPTKET
jgi:stress response protein YsnF